MMRQPPRSTPAAIAQLSASQAALTAYADAYGEPDATADERTAKRDILIALRDNRATNAATTAAWAIEQARAEGEIDRLNGLLAEGNIATSLGLPEGNLGQVTAKLNALTGIRDQRDANAANQSAGRRVDNASSLPAALYQ